MIESITFKFFINLKLATWNTKENKQHNHALLEYVRIKAIKTNVKIKRDKIFRRRYFLFS